ncbi:hypothetical protein Hanom_Chr15g01370641 [Helianthus anomalus]
MIQDEVNGRNALTHSFWDLRLHTLDFTNRKKTTRKGGGWFRSSPCGFLPRKLVAGKVLIQLNYHVTTGVRRTFLNLLRPRHRKGIGRTDL